MSDLIKITYDLESGWTLEIPVIGLSGVTNNVATVRRAVTCVDTLIKTILEEAID